MAVRHFSTAVAIGAGLAVMAVAPASAQSEPGWSQGVAAGGIYSARYADRGVQLAVRCQGNALEVVYYIDAGVLDPALKGRSSAIFGVTIADSGQVLWVEGKLIAVGNATSIGVGGGAADQIAHSIAAATRYVAASLLTEPPRNDTPQYNRAEFPSSGAADAIKAAYAGCGRPF